MRKPGLLATLLTAAVVALPVAAHAATYQSLRYADPTGDAVNRQGGEPGPSKPAIDITDSKANVTADRFKITVSYLGLKPRPYIRYIAGVIDSKLGQGSVLELRASGTSSKAVLYKATRGNASFALKRLTCAGVSAKPDYAARTITFWIPTACYKGRLSNGAGFLLNQTAAWTEDTWENGDLVLGSTTQYAEDDATYGWTWDPSATARPARKVPAHLRVW